MITWLGAVPGFLAAAALVLLPGAVVAAAWLRRGLPTLLLAAPLSLAVVAVASVGAPLVGLRWTPIPIAVVALVAAAPGVVLGRRGHAVPWSGWVAVLGGWAVAGALAAVTFRLGIGRPDAVSQSYDAVFHLNALRYVAETGSASPRDLTGMTGATGFYPSLWHAVAALVVPAAGGSVPAAANLTSMAVALVVWPLGSALLTRQLLGPRPVPVGAAAVLSMAFVSFPWFPLSWGVLWPNTLGIALIPAVLACLLSALGVARDDLLGGPWQAVAALSATGVACADAHPGAFVSALVLGAILALATAITRCTHSRGQSTAGAGVLQLLVTLAGVALVGAALFLVPGIRNTAADWAATTTVGRATWRELIGGPDATAPAYTVALLTLVGALACLTRARLWWLVPAHAASVGLDALAAGTDAPISQELTGFWYNDRYRLAAVVPVTGTLLAVVGVGALAAALARRTRANRAVLAAALLALAAVPTRAFGLGAHADFLAVRYLLAEDSPTASLLSPAEQAFLRDRLPRDVPPGAVIAGDPWDGSSLAWAIGDRDVLFRHFNGRFTPDQRYLADHLRDAATDPRVCPALRDTGVRYVLSLGPLFDPPLLTPTGWGGIQAIDGQPGFTLVAAEGTARLYEVTACDR